MVHFICWWETTIKWILQKARGTPTTQPTDRPCCTHKSRQPWSEPRGKAETAAAFYRSNPQNLPLHRLQFVGAEDPLYWWQQCSKIKWDRIEKTDIHWRLSTKTEWVTFIIMVFLYWLIGGHALISPWQVCSWFWISYPSIESWLRR